MGELAEEMISGACCSICGVYFEEEHGYPVACEFCWEPDCGLEKAIEKEL